MQTRTKSAVLHGGRWKNLLLGPLVALAAYSGASAQTVAVPSVEDLSRTSGRTSYSVINLAPQDIANNVFINARNQVAFDITGPEGRAVGMFYDGKTVRNTGLGSVLGLNELGQVAGIAATRGVVRAHRWTREGGLVDLGALGSPPGESLPLDINDRGVVVGSSAGHAAVFLPDRRVLDLGTLGGRFSSAHAINDGGQVTGWAETASGNMEAFIWSKATGMRSLGTLGGPFSQGFHINEAGQVAGISTNSNDLLRPFLWSRQQGMISIEGGRNANDLNDKGMVVGVDTSTGRAFVWSRDGGIIYPGNFGGTTSVAVRVNNRGQVVGSAQAPDGPRAFVWTRGEGLVDLNTRIPHAPPGLVLTFARAISENGAIVASSNAGLVLLLPRASSHAAPLVGPIKSATGAHVHATLSFSAAFRDANPRNTHKAVWSWGDGNKTWGTVSEKNGVGSVSGQHAYRAAGSYKLRLTVTSSTGASTTVEQTVVVRK